MTQVRFENRDKEELHNEKADRRLHPDDDDRVEGSHEELFAAESTSKLTVRARIGEVEVAMALDKNGESRLRSDDGADGSESLG
jgi:hypothetical protein